MKKALKVKLFFLTILLAFTLIGCSSVKSYLGKQMMKQSSVLEDANYKSFEQYRIEGKLDPDGYYQYEDETTGASLGTVYITFASNNNLKVQYYADPSHRTAIDISNCYMEPGDSVYAECT